MFDTSATAKRDYADEPFNYTFTEASDWTYDWLCTESRAGMLGKHFKHSEVP